MATFARAVLAAGTLLLTSLSAQAVLPYRITDLGHLPDGGGFSQAFGINSAGQVVGFSGDPPTPEAFQWTAGAGMRGLGVLPLDPPDLSAGQGGIARATNDAGRVVGESLVNVGPGPTSFSRAFLWSADKGMQDLGDLPGKNDSRAHAINNAGQVVGSSSVFFGGSGSFPSFPLDSRRRHAGPGHSAGR